MTNADRRDAFRVLAKTLDKIDVEAYAACGQDPLEPVIGRGEKNSRIAFFGRDPGRDEVRHQMPFIGAGGQKVRAAVYQHLYADEMPDFDASVEVGKYFFWANTVPYKPVGNKAWSMKVKKQFQPLMADLLINGWKGCEIITLGREAFLWFGINQEKCTRDKLEQFWSRPDRFESCCEIELGAPDGRLRALRLLPLPHPSPLNATWYKRFPDLLRRRLEALGVSLENWRQ